MTFKALWTSIKVAWQSRPLALILPVVALAVYWVGHGHTWTAASFPSMTEWAAGTALLFTKFGNILEMFVGKPDPATLPAPVAAPLVKRLTGEVPKVPIVLLIGLSLLMGACSLFQKKVTAIEADIKSCVTTDGPQSLKDIENAAVPFLEQAFMCDAESGFDPNAIPACLLASLSGVEAQVGPDAKRFEQCLVTTIENDPAAAKPVKQRARLVNVKLALGR